MLPSSFGVFHPYVLQHIFFDGSLNCKQCLTNFDSPFFQSCDIFRLLNLIAANDLPEILSLQIRLHTRWPRIVILTVELLHTSYHLKVSHRGLASLLNTKQARPQAASSTIPDCARSHEAPPATVPDHLLATAVPNCYSVAILDRRTITVPDRLLAFVIPNRLPPNTVLDCLQYCGRQHSYFNPRPTNTYLNTPRHRSSL